MTRKECGRARYRADYRGLPRTKTEESATRHCPLPAIPRDPSDLAILSVPRDPAGWLSTKSRSPRRSPGARDIIRTDVPAIGPEAPAPAIL